MSSAPGLFIADPDPAFQHVVNADPKSREVVPVFAKNGPDAQSILKEEAKTFLGIIVNPTVSNPLGIMVIRLAHFFRPGVPIFLLVDQGSKAVSEFKSEILTNLGIKGILTKPISYSDLIERLRGKVPSPEPGASAKKEPVAARADVRTDDSAFFSTPIANFLATQVALFDIYVRLGENRYVKVSHSGDVLDQRRILQYQDKGATALYIRKEDQNSFLEYCDQLTAAILRNPDAWSLAKTEATLRQGHEVIRYLQDTGLSDETVGQVKSYVENVRQLVIHTEMAKKEQIKTFVDQVALYEHGVSVSMIAALLAKELGIENQKSVQIVGVASMLHDIGLRNLPEKFQNEDIKSMSKEELEIYSRHPIWGAEEVRTLPNIEPVVPQIIEQHHERKNHRGFPHGIGGNNLLTMAEIVGLASDFARLIEQSRRNPDIHALEEIKFKLPDYSPQLAQAFRSVFFLEADQTHGGLITKLVRAKQGRQN